MKDEARKHKPVMTAEVLYFLHNKKNIIDATVGTGGHSEKFLEQGSKVLGIDADEKMLALAAKNLAGKGKFVLVSGNFLNIDKIVKANGFSQVDGIIFDLGISSVHLDEDSRGFSFNRSGDNLDMRLSYDLQINASDLLNNLREDQLVRIFERTMDRVRAKRMTNVVLRKRAEEKFQKVSDFLELFGEKTGKTHPATNAFLALRMAVNSELEVLEEALKKAFEILIKNGVLVVISFHSGEDRIVKKMMKEKSLQAEVLTSKPVLPSSQEIKGNPRSRSAKLRAIKKI